VDPGALDLLSLLSHQLLTPLALIDSSAQRLIRRADEMEPSEIKERAGRIRSATEYLSSLVSSLMARARFGSGQISVETKECRLWDLAARACNYVRNAQPCREFRIDLATDHLEGDPLLLEQVLVILLCNAAKYSPENTPITLTGDSAGGMMSLSVKDHGIGIPSDDLPRLFQPFFRCSNTTSYIGTGLGLSLADRIVRLHGGFITVESEEGNGSTFTVRLPVRR
jgi:signal transduction histidine kinase